MSIVKITPASEAISCKAGDSSTFQFNISNDAGRDLRIGLQIRADGEACQWLTPDGALERDLSAGVDTTVSVVATPPQNMVGEGQATKTATPIQAAIRSRVNFKKACTNASNPTSRFASSTAVRRVQ